MRDRIEREAAIAASEEGPDWTAGIAEYCATDGRFAFKGGMQR